MKKSIRLILISLISFLTLISCASTPDNTAKSQWALKSVYLSTINNREINSREKWIDADLKIENKNYKIQVKGRGNSSWGRMQKHSFSIKFSDSTKMLDMNKSKRWVLISNYSDKTLIRNQYAEYLGRNIFTNIGWTPTYRQVNLFLNNKYQGTYLLGEQIKLEKNRLKIQPINNIKEDINKDGKTDIKDGGFIFEINRREDEAYNFRTTHDVSISLKDPDEVGPKTQARIKSIIQTAEDALFSKNYKDPNKGYAKYFDVDSLVDWYIINEFSKNVDSAWYSSIYLYYDPSDEKIHFGALWDYDLGFGNVNYNDCFKTEKFYIMTRSVWFSRLFLDPAFKAKVRDRWNAKKGELKKSINSQIDKLASKVEDSAEYNFQVWPILGSYVWPNADGFEKRLTYKSEVEYMKDWCTKRYNWMDSVIAKW